MEFSEQVLVKISEDNYDAYFVADATIAGLNADEGQQVGIYELVTVRRMHIEESLMHEDAYAKLYESGEGVAEAETETVGAEGDTA